MIFAQSVQKKQMKIKKCLDAGGSISIQLIMVFCAPCTAILAENPISALMRIDEYGNHVLCVACIFTVPTTVARSGICHLLTRTLTCAKRKGRLRNPGCQSERNSPHKTMHTLLRRGSGCVHSAPAESGQHRFFIQMRTNVNVT